MYYCENCQKFHADKYYAHLKYKREISAEEPLEPNNNDFLKRFRKIEQKLKKQERLIDTMIKVLKAWSPMFSLKFPQFQRKEIARWLESV